MKYQTFGPDAEVSGASMLAFVQSINYANFSQVLAAHGLDHIDPEKWYPQQMWLDVFTDINSQQGAVLDLVSIGMLIAETAPIPPEMTTLPFTEMMLHFNEGSYLANNRGKDIGGIETQIVNDKHILILYNTPYPDDFVYGVSYGMARKFLAGKSAFKVKYDDTVTRREEGGAATLVHITWD